MPFVFNKEALPNRQGFFARAAEPLFRFTSDCSNPAQTTAQILPSAHPGHNQSSTFAWTHKIDLGQLPTKPEDLCVNMRVLNEYTGPKKSKTLSVSGKSEVNTNDKNGIRIFSVHNWQTEILLPKNLDDTTLACKMEKNWVVFTAEFEKGAEPLFLDSAEITIDRTIGMNCTSESSLDLGENLRTDDSW